MSNFFNGIQLLTSEENNLDELFGKIIKIGTNLISEKYKIITKEKLLETYTKFELINDKISFGFFIYNTYNDFVCLASTIKSQGINQVDFVLEKNSPTYNALIAKQKITDYEILFDNNYYCSFIPIIDSLSNQILGCHFVGINMSLKFNINTNTKIGTNIISKQQSPYEYIKNCLITFNNIFGNISSDFYLSTDNKLTSNIGEFDRNTIENNLYELTNYINFKFVYYTIFTYANNYFTQIATSEKNKINVIFTLSDIYDSLIKLNSYSGIVTEYEINYYTNYCPIIDKNTQLLIGCLYIKFGPYNMI